MIFNLTEPIINLLLLNSDYKELVVANYSNRESDNS